MEKIFLVFFIILLFFSANLVIAGGRDCPTKGLVPCGNVDTCPCEFCDFFVLFDNIIDFLLIPCALNSGAAIVPLLAALMIVVGGGMYILSAGNPAMISRAKSLFIAVVIGLVVIYGAWIFVNTFLMLIGAADWEGFGRGWWKIPCP